MNVYQRWQLRSNSISVMDVSVAVNAPLYVFLEDLEFYQRLSTLATSIDFYERLSTLETPIGLYQRLSTLATLIAEIKYPQKVSIV